MFQDDIAEEAIQNLRTATTGFERMSSTLSDALLEDGQAEQLQQFCQVINDKLN
jgi:hypothetical protein